MKKYLQIISLTLIVAFSSFVGLAGSTYAAGGVVDNSSKGQVCNGIGLVGGGSSACKSGSGQSGVQNLVGIIINLLSWLVGIIAVIFIIVAALKYITSGGSSDKISSAKNTLIYALIGIAIAALAQFLVHFVITTSTNTCPTNNKLAFSAKSCAK